VRGRDPVGLAALGAGALGALLLFAFDAWFTRALGVLGLLAFIAGGVFAIATPAFLERDDDED
jgi:hypothetical protein